MAKKKKTVKNYYYNNGQVYIVSELNCGYIVTSDPTLSTGKFKVDKKQLKEEDYVQV